MLHEQQTVCYMNNRQCATWTTDSMLHERSTESYMNNRQYATWTTYSMPHERQTVCYMNDIQYATHNGFRTYRTERLNILWDATCQWVSSFVQTRLVILDCLNLKMNALWFFEPSGTTHSATQYNIPEDLNLQHHCCENPRSWFQNFSKKVINIAEISYMYSQEC